MAASSLLPVLVRVSKCPLVVPTPERIAAPMDGSSLIIGRNEQANVQLRASDSNGTMQISRQHAKFSYDRDAKVAYILDLGSVNGVYINNKRLAKNAEKRLRFGDIVSFGTDPGNDKCEFLYEVREEQASKPVTDLDLMAFVRVKELEKQLQAMEQEIQKERTKGQTLEQSLLSEKSMTQSLKGSLKQQKEESDKVVAESEERARNVKTEFTQFKDKLRERLECPICFVNKPKSNMILRCGHVVCEACLKDWKKKSNACPTCNEKTKDQAVRAYIVDEFISLLDEYPCTPSTKSGNLPASTTTVQPRTNKTREGSSTTAMTDANNESALNTRKKLRSAVPDIGTVVDLT